MSGTSEARAAAPAPVVPLRRNHGFRLLWIGQILSDTGSEVSYLAYPLLILALTHSAVIAGVVGTARSTVQFCLRLPAGALSDRLDRRMTMIVCDTARAVLLALLGLLVLLHLASWPAVLVVALVDGGAGTIFDPAATAALPGIVPDGQLEQAWAATEARTYGASLAGPALGGVLFGLARSVPFLGDAVSYVVSAGTVGRIRGRFRPEKAAGRKPLWREIVEGLQLVWRVPLLRAVVLQAPLVNFAFNGVIFAITLALRRHGTSPEVIGLVQAGIAAGGLLGAIVAPRLQRRLRLSVLVIAITFAAAVLFGGAALLIPSPLVAAPVAMSLLLAPAANAALFAVMLRATPEQMRGRVSNSVIMVATGMAALAPLAAGLLVQQVSGAWAIGAFAAAMAAAAALCVVLPGLRDAESAASGSGQGSLGCQASQADEETVVSLSRVEQVETPDGSFDLTVWLPAPGSGPGLLLLQEIFGVNDYISAVAEDLAGLGYVVAAPDLFWRLKPGHRAAHDEAGLAESLDLGGRFDAGQGVADAAAALDRLRSLPEVAGGTGVIGFCLGGSIAFFLAARRELDAVVSFYGSAVPDNLAVLEQVTSPVQFHFGGRDPYIPREQVARVQEAVTRHGSAEIHVEPDAGHAFHNRKAPMFYVAEPAARAWRRTEEFLRRHLPARSSSPASG